MPSNTLPHSHGRVTEEFFQQMLETKDFQTLSFLFKRLSDPSRIWILCHCEECVINLSSLMYMSSPAVAHHLKLLRTSNLIQCGGREKRSIINLPIPYRPGSYTRSLNK